jgi:cold shock CspA family protein
MPNNNSHHHQEDQSTRHAGAGAGAKVGGAASAGAQAAPSRKGAAFAEVEYVEIEAALTAVETLTDKNNWRGGLRVSLGGRMTVASARKRLAKISSKPKKAPPWATTTESASDAAASSASPVQATTQAEPAAAQAAAGAVEAFSSSFSPSIAALDAGGVSDGGGSEGEGGGGGGHGISGAEMAGDEANGARRMGRVFAIKEGYGFITPFQVAGIKPTREDNLYFVTTHLQQQLCKGDAVSYEFVLRSGKPNAINVESLPAAAAKVADSGGGAPTSTDGAVEDLCGGTAEMAGDEANGARQTGSVFAIKEGYGFITPDQVAGKRPTREDNLHFLTAPLQQTLSKGDAVSYEFFLSSGKPNAINIELLPAAAAKVADSGGAPTTTTTTTSVLTISAAAAAADADAVDAAAAQSFVVSPPPPQRPKRLALQSRQHRMAKGPDGTLGFALGHRSSSGDGGAECVAFEAAYGF